jgi:ABC-type cobalamin/Fe3+-siderophores transport system ATPase subunit
MNSEYASAIVSALRGSGLHFNDVAPFIADQISPREFVEFVENEDAEGFAKVTDLPLARAVKIIDRVDEQGVEDILTASIEDGVTLSLLDGTDYKTTEQLSTGQRCTVVLPILLQQQGVTLIIDQPEDHLDNAFIVETLVAAIIDRKETGQLIFSTHNPNIPVLGGADQVSLMGSDGSRGFILHSGTLDNPRSVEAITSVMEGGLEAFDRRSRFYHGKPAAMRVHGTG